MGKQSFRHFTNPERGNLFRGGFTFIEVILSVALLGFIAVSIYGVLSVGDMTWRTEMSLMGIQQEVRLAIDGMSRELRQAETISDPDGGSTISFTIPNVSENISYYLSNSQIIREHPAGTTKILAKDISSLSFDKSSNEVTISLTAVKTARGRSLQFALTQKVRLRNE